MHLLVSRRVGTSIPIESDSKLQSGEWLNAQKVFFKESSKQFAHPEEEKKCQNKCRVLFQVSGNCVYEAN